jgi:hypothetical protein
MGWRENVRVVALLDQAAQSMREIDTFGHMPTADRIALARELLANTGRVVAREVDAMAYADDLDPAVNGHRDGWNACRAAMLAGTGKHIAGAFETENAASAREEA